MGFYKKILVIILLLGAFSTTVYFQKKHPQRPLKESVKFNFNDGFASFTPDSLKLISFGYDRFLTGMLWIRFRLNTIPHSMGENEVSWMYLDLNTISILDPDFSIVFTHATIFLSVITEDKLGARLLMEKGVRKYPKLWKLRAYLAYHYHFEINEIALAAEQYEEAAKLEGAPTYTMSALAARLKRQTGRNKESEVFLENMIKNTTDKEIRKKLIKKLKSYRGQPNNG